MQLVVDLDPFTDQLDGVRYRTVGVLKLQFGQGEEDDFDQSPVDEGETNAHLNRYCQCWRDFFRNSLEGIRLGVDRIRSLGTREGAVECSRTSSSFVQTGFLAVGRYGKDLRRAFSSDIQGHCPVTRRRFL